MVAISNRIVTTVLCNVFMIIEFWLIIEKREHGNGMKGETMENEKWKVALN